MDSKAVSSKTDKSKENFKSSKSIKIEDEETGESIKVNEEKENENENEPIESIKDEGIEDDGTEDEDTEDEDTKNYSILYSVIDMILGVLK